MIALTRKNALFAGNEVGAENWAMPASLVATCKLSAVNPVDYLADTLRAILDGHPKSRIEALMPSRYAQPSSVAAWGSDVAYDHLALLKCVVGEAGRSPNSLAARCWVFGTYLSERRGGPLSLPNICCMCARACIYRRAVARGGCNLVR